MRTIGLIGGMSWQSTAHYYRILNEETARRLGGLHSAPVIVDSLDFAPVAALQAEGRWDDAGAMLHNSARRLVGAGAEVIGLATNTMHIAADAMMAGIDARFVHIAEPTAQALIADGYETVGLLGTRFTMEMGFYREHLTRSGLNALVPEVDRTNLDGIIYQELCRGIIREESRRIYVDAISRLAASGAEAVILGCTEINMLVDDSSSPLPCYDTTELHARALVSVALD
jgi:aspartate racemase